MILITGAAGSVGSNLVAALNDSGRDDLILCDWLGDDGRWENLVKRSFADLRRPDEIEQFLATSTADKIDTVVHLGAITDTTAENGDLVWERNCRFSKMLWHWCARHPALLVYASSAATYGNGGSGFKDGLSLEDLKALRPLNLYAWSKHVFDLFAMGAPPEMPPRWYGLKLFNVFGPNEYHKGPMASLIYKNAQNIISGQPSSLFAWGVSEHAGPARDFIHVDDVCAAILHFVRGSAASGIYNVGTGIAQSFQALLSAAYRAAGNEPCIEYVPMPEELRARYQYFTEADTQKLRASGFDRAFPPLEDRVASYVSNFLMNADRFR